MEPTAEMVLMELLEKMLMSMSIPNVSSKEKEDSMPSSKYNKK